MTEKINLHTHCTFCDGKNSAREMVESAIAKGFTSLGFSSHCTYPVDPEFYRTPDDFWHIPAAKIGEYQAEINRLKAEYSDRIQIFSGFEADFFEIPGAGSAHPDFSAYSSLNPDYLIGSVHFVNSNKGFYTVDHSADNVKENLDAKIYETLIPRNIRLAEAPSHGLPINMYDAKSAGTESYRLLAKEVMERMEK